MKPVIKFDAVKFYDQFRTGNYGNDWKDPLRKIEHEEALEATVHAALNLFGDKLDALEKAKKALTFAKPMIGALAADSPTAAVRSVRKKVYTLVEEALDEIKGVKRAG